MNPKGLFLRLKVFGVISVVPGVILFMNYHFLSGIFAAKTDASLFLYGTGLNWLVNEPMRVWHMPGYLWSEISALFLILGNNSGSDIQQFQKMGLFFQYGILVVSLVWSTVVILRAKISIKIAIGLSFIFFCMPTALAYSYFWGHNFPISALIFPISLCFCSWYKKEGIPKVHSYGALIVLGVLSSNFFSGLVVSGSIILVSFLILFFKKEYPFEGFEDNKYLYSLYYIATTIVLWFALKNVESFFGKDFPAKTIFGLGLLIMAGISFLSFFRNYATNVIFPYLIGVILGVNYFLPYWAYSFISAIKSKGGAIIGDNEKSSFLEIITSLLMHSSWNYYILIILVSSFFLYRKWSVQNVFLIITANMILFLTFWGSGRSVFQSVADGGYGGLGITPMRYLIFIPVPIAFALFAMNKNLKKNTQILWLFICAGIGVSCFFQYYTNNISYAIKASQSYEKLDNYLDGLSQKKDVNFLYNRIQGVRYANLLYAYNSYRSNRSISKLKKDQIENYHYANLSFEDEKELTQFLHKKDFISSELYVVHEGKLEGKFFLQEIYYDHLVDLGVSRLINH